MSFKYYIYSVFVLLFSCCQFAFSESYIVNAKNELKMRMEPNKDSKVVGKIPCLH